MEIFKYYKTSKFQLNYKYDKFVGPNVLTIGSEYTLDDVMDEIVAYNYLVDQKVAASEMFCSLIGI